VQVDIDPLCKESCGTKIDIVSVRPGRCKPGYTWHLGGTSRSCCCCYWNGTHEQKHFLAGGAACESCKAAKAAGHACVAAAVKVHASAVSNVPECEAERLT
jgi:hypothetical protein